MLGLVKWEVSCGFLFAQCKAKRLWHGAANGDLCDVKGALKAFQDPDVQDDHGEFRGAWKNIWLVVSIGWWTNSLHTRTLRWQWKITIFNRKYIFKLRILHCRVSFRGGNIDWLVNQPSILNLVVWSSSSFFFCIFQENDFGPGPNFKGFFRQKSPKTLADMKNPNGVCGPRILRPKRLKSWFFLRIVPCDAPPLNHQYVFPLFFASILSKSKKSVRFFLSGFGPFCFGLPIMNVKIHGFVRGLSPFWCPAVCFRGSNSPNKLGDRVITSMDLVITRTFPTKRQTIRTGVWNRDSYSVHSPNTCSISCGSSGAITLPPIIIVQRKMG